MNSLYPITRVDIRPLRCSIKKPPVPMPDKPYLDPREQGVDRSARPAPLSYQATPESIAAAKQAAAEERRQHEAERDAYERKRQEMVNQLAAFVDEFGHLAVSLELDRLVDR